MDLEQYLTHRVPRENECFFEKVGITDFYRDIFGKNILEDEGEYTEGKYNGIIIDLFRSTGHPCGRWFLHDDLGGLDRVWMNKNHDKDFFMSPLSYAGKDRTLRNARQMFALTFDIDNVDCNDNKAVGFECLMNAVRCGNIPAPTYTVTSGHGIHLYYVFKEPISLYTSNCKEMQKLKKALTSYLWNMIAAPGTPVQFQSINQAFRMPDSPTKTGKLACAFRTGDKVSVEDLNRSVPAASRASLYHPSGLSWEDAKEKYPSWAERVQDGRKSKTGRKTWVNNPSLYEWWKKQAYTYVRCGRRYWCLFATSVFAAKCGISEDVLHDDLIAMVHDWDKLSTDPANRLSVYDAECAMKGYGEEYRTFPINSISALTGITITKNKRNGRKQSEHLALCREHSRYKRTAIHTIAAWRKAHKHGGIRQCVIETGLSRSTVYKWWRKCLTIKADGAYTPKKQKRKHITKHTKTICPDCGAYIAMDIERHEWTWKRNGKKYRKIVRICPACGCRAESKAHQIHRKTK